MCIQCILVYSIVIINIIKIFEEHHSMLQGIILFNYQECNLFSKLGFVVIADGACSFQGCHDGRGWSRQARGSPTSLYT